MTQQNSSRAGKLYADFLKLVTKQPTAVGIVAVVLAAALLLWLLGSGRAENKAQPTAAVQRGPLTISISESGTVKSREQVILKSSVEGRTTILSLIPEGTNVKAGDLLVELDTSTLEDQRTSQQITVLNAEASFVRARETLEVTKSQGNSDTAKADLDCRFADIDLNKYLEGEYPQQLQKADSDITLAKIDLERAAEDLTWSEQLAAEGYITRTELEGDKLAKRRAELSLSQAKTQLDLLEKYTYNRELERLKSDVTQTKMALDRVKRKAAADVVQAEADLKARESEFNRQKTKLDKLNDQINKCRIKAPVDAMVVYATTATGERHGNQQPLAEGQEVRERQELIYLPTAAAMRAEIKVQESALRKVSLGLPVRVTVDALPGRVFYGAVSKIGVLPDAQSQWLNPDLTVYSTAIDLQGDMKDLRPGMSCRAEVIVDQYDDALFVPVQAVTRVSGKPTVYVKTGSDFEPRTIEVGLDNNRVIRVASGLKEGEVVSLTPPLEAASYGAQGEGGAAIPAGVARTGSSDSNLAANGARAGQPAAAFDPEKLRSMSSEERQKFFESMTDEQRAAMRSQFGGRRTGVRQDDGTSDAGEGTAVGSSDSRLRRPRLRSDGSTDSRLDRPRSRDGAAGGRRGAADGSASSGEGSGSE